MAISLIVGLGNPGRKYDLTRHNVGFMMLDRMALLHSAEFRSEAKWQSHIAKLTDHTLLVKPQTFMNLSGRAVRQMISFFKIEPSNMLVVYDDVALPLGNLRFREKGSAGGHNGIKSIIAELGSDQFPRLKLGIAGSQEYENLSDHVLGKFHEKELDTVENMLATACDAVHVCLSQGMAHASNQFNTSKTKPTPTHPDETQI